MERSVIGVDVDKESLKVCLVSRDLEERCKVKGSRTFKNSSKGHRELLEWANKKQRENQIPLSWVMEATGVYHEKLAHYLHRNSEQVHVVLPLRAKRYFQSLGSRSKTDELDARGLSQMGIDQQLENWEPGELSLLALRSLTRQVESLQKSKTMFKNQLEAVEHAQVVHKEVRSSIKRMIIQLEKQVGQLENAIKETISNSELLRTKYKHYSTLKGVGLQTFAVVASETNGFEYFKNQRQLVCYSGYDVVENQSGKRVGKTKISKKGNSHIRRIMHMSSLSAINNQVPVYYNLYQRVYDRTGIKMKGYVAVQRKLLVTMYTLWKKDEEFDPEFEKKKNYLNEEPKPFFSEKAVAQRATARDRSTCNESPVAFFSVG